MGSLQVQPSLPPGLRVLHVASKIFRRESDVKACGCKLSKTSYQRLRSRSPSSG